MDREAWWATSSWGHIKADVTEATVHTHTQIKYFKTNHKFYSIFFFLEYVAEINSLLTTRWLFSMYINLFSSFI